jgi:hypothetical protein
MLLQTGNPALYFGAARGGVGVAGVWGEGGQPIDGHTAGVGVVVKPACHHEALGFAQSAGEGGVCGVGCPVGAWDVGACARDGGAIKGDGVGVVCGDGVEGMAEQVLEGGVGFEVALEVSVVAVGDVVGVGVLGACELGDGFSCGGDEFGAGELLEGAVGFGACGVEGCGADEVLEVVY